MQDVRVTQEGYLPGVSKKLNYKRTCHCESINIVVVVASRVCEIAQNLCANPVGGASDALYPSLYLGVWTRYNKCAISDKYIIGWACSSFAQHCRILQMQNINFRN